MTALDLAVGSPIGLEPPDRAPRRGGAAARGSRGRRQRGRRSARPCCVAFSGGRDSSLVMAASVRAAARARVRAAHRGDHPFRSGVRDRRERVADPRPRSPRRRAPRRDRRHRRARSRRADRCAPSFVRRGALFPANSHALAPLVAPRGRWKPAARPGRRRASRRPSLDAAERRSGASPATPAREISVGWQSPRYRRRTRARMPLGAGVSIRPHWLRGCGSAAIRRSDRAHAANEPVRFDRVVPHAARVRTARRRRRESRGVSRMRLVSKHLSSIRGSCRRSRAPAEPEAGAIALRRCMRSPTVCFRTRSSNRRDKARFDAVYFGGACRDASPRSGAAAGSTPRWSIPRRFDASGSSRSPISGRRSRSSSRGSTISASPSADA